MFRQWHTPFLIAVLLPLTFASAIAGPNGATVAAGSATVQGQGTASVVVNQTSQSAIINWQTFNIGAGETTKIVMPSASSTELDRVTGAQGPSQIFGSLSSNGQVFLVNPDGILFGKGAQVNVGGLLATTHDIANRDFMAGRYNFFIPGNPNASIVNEGHITAQTGGFAALVAPGVRNTGTITATLGKIGLASANSFALDFYGDRLIQLNVNDSIAGSVIDVSTGQPLKSLVSNEGTLKANGGRVELTAVAARQVVDSVINNSGVIEANTIGSHNGMIVLEGATGASKPAGAPTQTVKVSGTLSAAGKRKGTTGGTVEVTGESVQLNGATINATGRGGGGAVLIGGDWGGGSPNTSLVSNQSAYLQPYAVPSASSVSVDALTKIDASATDGGNGGKVIVWSDEATTFFGTIFARGGAQGGNGGFVEVSGHQLSFNGTVDTSAPIGAKGTLLLDPLDAIIDTNPGSEVITVASVETGLLTSNVTVSTVGTVGSEPGNITVNAPVTWTSASTLTLSAANNIAINAAITGTNGGLNLNAGGGFPFATIAAIAPVAVGTFNLQAGQWTQVTPNLPAFSAKDFQITGGSFLRVLGGDGSTGSPYQIADIYGLQGIAGPAGLSLPPGGTFLSSNFVLENNIDASGTANWNGGAGFVPIGGLAPLSSFSGSFDGQGHSITKLTISSAAAEVGLFGVIASSGIVQNLTLVQANVAGTGANNFSREVGTLAGANEGVIRNVSVVDSNVVIVAGTGGGLVGRNNGTIEQSSADAKVAATDPTSILFNFIGGLVGFNGGGGIGDYAPFGTIIQSSASGVASNAGQGVAAGLVGVNNGSITQSFASASVSGETAGGLVGQNEGIISKSYATSSVSATGQGGGLTGINDGSIATSSSGGSVSVSGSSGQSGGGLVGFNTGTISKSFSTAAVSVSQGQPAGVEAGGFVGVNVGTIEESFSTGSVSLNASAGLTSIPSAGGFVGVNSFLTSNGTILDSYAAGTVTGGTSTFEALGGFAGVNNTSITRSYSIGAVTGGGTGSPVGGFVGLVNSLGRGAITDSYWDIQSSGISAGAGSGTAGATGLATAVFRSALPSGLVVTPAVWGFTSGSYPFLLWQTVGTPPTPTPTPTPSPTPIQEPTPNPPPTLPPGQNQINPILTITFNPTVAGSTPPVINNLNTITTQTSSAQTVPPPQDVTVLGSTTTVTTSIELGGQTIQFQIQQEAPNGSGNLSLDCLATVYAMLGSIIETQETGVVTTYFAKTYINPNNNYDATINPKDGETPGVGAPEITLAVPGGLTTGPSAGAPLGVPNPAVFSKNASLQNLTSFPAIIGGTIIGVTTNETLPHFMLAVGIDQKTGYVVAIDPLTGKQVEINPLSSMVVGATGQLATFKAVGFVGVTI